MPSFTITYPAGAGARFAAALGKAKGLVDIQVPPQPRSATPAECKQFVIERIRQLIVDIEGKALTDAAVAAIVVPPMDLT